DVLQAEDPARDRSVEEVAGAGLRHEIDRTAHVVAEGDRALDREVGAELARAHPVAPVVAEEEAPAVELGVALARVHAQARRAVAAEPGLGLAVVPGEQRAPDGGAEALAEAVQVGLLVVALREVALEARPAEILAAGAQVDLLPRVPAHV